jgi:hypothetical protein
MAIKRHTPSLESVWAEWERAKRVAKRHAARPALATRPRIPDNSEPWLSHPPRTLADVYYISGRVAEVVTECRKKLRKL